MPDPFRTMKSISQLEGDIHQLRRAHKQLQQEFMRVQAERNGFLTVLKALIIVAPENRLEIPMSAYGLLEPNDQVKVESDEKLGRITMTLVPSQTVLLTDGPDSPAK